MVQPVVDGFEDADFSGWSGDTGALSQSTSTVKNGSGSLQIEIVNGNNVFPYNEQGTAVEIDYVSFWVYFGATGTADDHRVYYKEGGNSGTTIFDFRFHRDDPSDFHFNGNDDVVTGINTNQWYLVEYKNLDWTNETGDLYFDGSLVGSYGFHNSSTNGVDTIQLTLQSPNSFDSHYDDLVMPAAAQTDDPGHIRQTKTGSVVQTKSATNGVVQKTNK